MLILKFLLMKLSQKNDLFKLNKIISNLNSNFKIEKHRILKNNLYEYFPFLSYFIIS